ncbi:hypothetical protein BH09GEM1_BH09GEM1_07050 [soil metagenome]
MRLSRMFRADDETPGENISLKRMLFWVAVWIGLLVGIALYFKYARLLTPLLA